MTRREMRAATQPPQSTAVPVDSAAIARLHKLIDECGRTNVSDMHIHPGKPARRLSRGNLSMDEGEGGIYSVEEIGHWLTEATSGRPDPLAERGHASVAMATDTYRVRGTFRKSMQGITVTFRLIPGEVPNADDVGVPEVIQKLTTKDSGLILVEGPTGSGKTTAIAGLIRKINHESNKHIYMVEDPPEFVHVEDGATSIIQREIGAHAVDYPTAIEDALRSKPNVIVVGELLNPATAKSALHAATTGHLVITTAHTGSISEALDSFVGQFNADEQSQIRSRLSQSLLAIMVQKLVPSVDGKLAAAREVMINNTNFTELIRDSKIEMIRAQLAGDPRCFTLEDSLANLVKEGKISVETAMGSAKSPHDLEATLRRSGMAVAA